MAMLEPEVAVLDETDSGLDIDALRVVARTACRRCAPTGPARGAARHPLPAHPRPARPDGVHVLVDGRIVEQRRPELADRLEAEGYDAVAEVTVTRTPTSDTTAPTSAPTRSRRTSRAQADSRSGPRARPGSSTSTRRPRRRSRARARRDGRTTTRRPTPTSTAGSTRSPRRRPACTRRPAIAVGRFIGAPDPEPEVIFTKNATEAINLVAAAWGRANLTPATSSCSPRWSTTPTWSLADAARRSGASSCGGSTLDDDVPARPVRPRPAARRGQARGVHGHVQRARDDHAGRADRRGRPPRPGRWSWSTAPSSCPTSPTDVGGARL